MKLEYAILGVGILVGTSVMIWGMAHSTNQSEYTKDQVKLCLSRNGVAHLNQNWKFEGCDLWPRNPTQ